MAPPSTEENYAVPPADVPVLSECTFYHTLDLPGVGVVRGGFDLRPGAAGYLGDMNFFGKRVLEIGVASGWVTFEMERRGAAVVGFDLELGMTYDAKPGAAALPLDAYRSGLVSIRNGFWLGHHLTNSKARVAYGHANHLPEWLGHFDIGVMANVLQHLKDPVGAIMQLSSRCNSIVITESDWMEGSYDDAPGLVYFGGKQSPFSWYQVKPKLVELVLSDLGFSNFVQTKHMQLFLNNTTHDENGPGGQDLGEGMLVPHYTITASKQK